VGTSNKSVRGRNKSQAGGLKERIVDPAVEAGSQAREWAQPRVAATAEKISPAIDATRDKLVEEVMPRVMEIVSAAIVNAAAAGHSGLDAAEGAASNLAERANRAKNASKRRARRRRLIIFTAAGAAGAGAVAAWRRTMASDPWQETAAPEPITAPAPPAGAGTGDGATAAPVADAEDAGQAGDGVTANPQRKSGSGT